MDQLNHFLDLLGGVNAVSLASMLAAFLLTMTRLLNAAKPFWDRLPEPWYSGIPVAVAVVPDFVLSLAGVKTGVDLMVQLIVVAGLVVPGARSAAHKDAKSETRELKRKITNLGMFLIVGLMGLSQPACTAAQGLNWPNMLHCAEPMSRDLVEAVEGILFQEGDPAAVLDQLAKQVGKDGPSVVACAISEFISNNGKLGDAPVELRAKARGRAFLESRGVAVAAP